MSLQSCVHNQGAKRSADPCLFGKEKDNKAHNRANHPKRLIKIA